METSEIALLRHRHLFFPNEFNFAQCRMNKRGCGNALYSSTPSIIERTLYVTSEKKTCRTEQFFER